jgi:CDP-diglyceride synthetase
MNQTLTPNFEVDLRPTALATVTVVIIGLVGNFVVMRPGLTIWAAILAGIVASLASGYYQSSGNNAAVGTLAGTLLLTPLLAYTRVTLGFGIENTTDIAFTSLALAGGWLIVVTIVLVPISYMSAAISDITRKKVGGPIGY